MTFTNDAAVVAPIRSMMLASREAVVNYMTPLGLRAHHGDAATTTGPARGSTAAARRLDADVLPPRRRASASASTARRRGSNAVGAVRAAGARRSSPTSRPCPESLLLWFHHVPLGPTGLRSGRTLWDELCHRYSAGVDAVRAMQATWDGLAGVVDGERHGRAAAPRHPGAGGALVARRQRALLPDVLAAAAPRPGLEPPAGTLAEYQKIRA